MVQLISIIFFAYHEGKQPTILASAYELSSFGFFQRSSVREVATFASREIIGKLAPGNDFVVNDQNLHTEDYPLTNDFLFLFLSISKVSVAASTVMVISCTHTFAPTAYLVPLLAMKAIKQESLSPSCIRYEPSSVDLSRFWSKKSNILMEI